MTKEEAKQYLRNLIDSSIKTQSEHDKNVFFLYHNKQYLRALKLSKITGQPVNKNNFKGGEKLFSFDTNYNCFGYYKLISICLKEKYTKDGDIINKLILEVLNDHEQYKVYKHLT